MVVILNSEEVEQVVTVLVLAGPQDEDLGLLDGRWTAILHVVNVEDLLAELVFEVVLVRNLL